MFSVKNRGKMSTPTPCMSIRFIERVLVDRSTTDSTLSRSVYQNLRWNWTTCARSIVRNILKVYLIIVRIIHITRQPTDHENECNRLRVVKIFQQLFTGILPPTLQRFQRGHSNNLESEWGIKIPLFKTQLKLTKTV